MSDEGGRMNLEFRLGRRGTDGYKDFPNLWSLDRGPRSFLTTIVDGLGTMDCQPNNLLTNNQFPPPL